MHSTAAELRREWERADAPDVSGPLEVCVDVHSVGTLRRAALVIAFFRGDHPVLSLTPTDEPAQADAHWWDVARIDDAGRMAPSAQSRQTRRDHWQR